MNIAVITVRVVLFGAVGEPNYGKRVGREASGVWGRSPHGNGARVKPLVMREADEIFALEGHSKQ